MARSAAMNTSVGDLERLITSFARHLRATNLSARTEESSRLRTNESASTVGRSKR